MVSSFNELHQQAKKLAEQAFVARRRVRLPIAPICWKSRPQNSHRPNRPFLSCIGARQRWR